MDVMGRSVVSFWNGKGDRDRVECRIGDQYK